MAVTLTTSINITCFYSLFGLKAFLTNTKSSMGNMCHQNPPLFNELLCIHINVLKTTEMLFFFSSDNLVGPDAFKVVQRKELMGYMNRECTLI